MGARPQFIKASVISREISKHKELKEILIHTGQHFDENMSKVFFDEMQIPQPDYELNINGISHGAMTGKMIEKIEGVLVEEKPDYVLIYGDTNSTIAGALAAKKIHHKIAHVEAGLRSFNNRMPEEINRILTDRISDYLFCPSEKAVENLLNEGFDKFDCEIVNTGDVMLDAALFYSEKTKSPDFEIPVEFILATIHREENTEDTKRLSSLIDALNKISLEIPIVLPLHPRTKDILNKSMEIKLNSQIKMVPPVSYLEMLYLLNNCSLVMTDSGGLQKEAFYCKKLCITLRDETEWTELVDHDFNIVCGTDEEKVLDAYNVTKNKKVNFTIDLYGDGKSSKKIISTLLN